MTNPKCAVCATPIPEKRIHAAQSRGANPLYCSERCKGTASMRRARAKAKKI